MIANRNLKRIRFFLTLYTRASLMIVPERKFRFLQLFCVFAVVTCIRIRLKVQGSTDGSVFVQWMVFALALSCTVQGFLVQRRITEPSPSIRRSARSTPFTRWRAGNLVRLGFPTAVGCWALILSEHGGQAWQVVSLFALSLLLLIWSPGRSPNATNA